MPLSPQDFEKELWRVHERVNLSENSFHLRFFRGEVSREELQSWALEYYPRDFTRLLAALYANCPYFDARELIAENMYEEHGRFRPGKDHPTLWRKFGEALGIGPEEMDGHRKRPAAQRFFDRLMEICRERSFVEGMAAVGFAIEAGVPALFSAMIPVLREKYRLSNEAIEFFLIHTVADEDHGRRALEILKKYADTDELQEKVIGTVREVLELATSLA